jgi:hypothetical protein
MTSLGAVASGLLAYSGAGSAYASAKSTSPSANGNGTASSGTDSSAATNVTLSAAAMAALATQDADASTTFATVTANARTLLDQLMAQAGVKGPLNTKGEATIDLSGIDGRTLFAVATNSQSLFSTDEQTAAAQEIQNRFDAYLKPRLAASDMTGNYTDVYKAAADYFDNMSTDEKATVAWTQARAAIDQGLQALKTNPFALPPGIANDPVAEYISRATQAPAATTDPTNFSDVATGARAALDAQALAAQRKGTQLAYTSQSKGQQIDWSSFDNQTLSAIVLNQGSQFSPQEVQASKTELNTRNRTAILQAFQQSQQSGDPRALSYSLLTQYAGMTDQERQASNWTTGFRDTAIANYQSASSLMSMLTQASGSSGGQSSGQSSIFDFM